MSRGARASKTARALARLYPRRLREARGEELELLLDHGLEQARGRGGLGRAVALAAVGLDVLRSRLRPTEAPATAIHRRPGEGPMRQLFHELHATVRDLARRPAWALVAVFTLALAIGANSLVFSLVRSVLLQPLPYAEPERVVAIFSQWTGFPKTWVSISEFALYRDTLESIDDIALFSQGTATIGGETEPERVETLTTTRNLLSLLGREPVIGRDFTAEDAERSAPVVLIDHALWQRRFQGRADAVGSSIGVNGEPHEVVGVLPARLAVPQDLTAGRISRVWKVAEDPPPFEGEPGGAHGFHSVARLAPGVGLQTLRAELELLNRKWDHTYPEEWQFRTLAVRADEEVAGRIRPVLVVLAAAVLLVLLIASVNLGNLALSRALARRRELAIRAALGAGRMRLVSGGLVEGLLLAGMGGGLGVVLAQGGLQLLRRWGGLSLPRLDEVTIDVRVLAFAAAVTLVGGLLFGAVPALLAARLRSAALLRATASSGARSSRWRAVAVAGQVALALVLLIGTLQLVRSAQALLRTDPGFERAPLWSFDLYLPPALYPEAEDVTAYYRSLLTRLETLPGVESAAAIRLLPLASEMGDWDIEVESALAASHEDPSAEWQSAAPGYFETMGIPVLSGRAIAPGDDAGAEPVIVVNEAFARSYFGDVDPLGRRVRLAGSDVWATVVGVVTDVKHNALTAPVKPRFYLPLEQFDRSTGFAVREMSVVARLSAEPAAVLPSLRRTVREQDPRIAIGELESMEEVLVASASTSRLAASLSSAFAGLAMLLAALGLYGVLGALSEQRRREVGIRVALGARPLQATASLMAAGARLTAVGLAAGLLLSLAGAGLLRGLLWGVEVRDPLTFVGAPLVLALVASLAAWLPLRRAARTDPNVVLRDE